jgi:hypothetical protein
MSLVPSSFGHFAEMQNAGQALNFFKLNSECRQFYL